MFSKDDALKAAEISREERWIVSILMLAYVSLVYAGISHHEPWFDETHAWLVAGRHSLWQLLTMQLRREGTPGLWHVLLWFFAKLHINFTVVRYLVGVLPCLTAFILLRFSPFSLWLRGLLPFTFFLLYQYGVIARQYIFFPFFVFLLISIAMARHWRPYSLALVAGLLANSSAYGFCVTVTLLPVLVMLRDRLPSATDTSSKRTGSAGPLTLLCVLLVIALATAAPLRSSSTGQIAAVHVLGIAAKDNAMVRYSDVTLGYERPEGMSPLQMELWQNTVLRKDDVTHHAFGWRCVRSLIILLGIVTFPIAKSWLLALTLLILAALRLHQLKALIALVPYVVLSLLCFGLRVSEHHAGMLFVTLVAVLWISESLAVGARSVAPRRRWNAFTLTDLLSQATLFAVCILQVSWGLSSVIHDVRSPYTGDKAFAQFLQSVSGTTTIAFGEYVDPMTSLLYLNGFRVWSLPGTQDANTRTLGSNYRSYAAELQSRPGLVVESEYLVGNENILNQVTPTARIGSDELSLTSTRLISHAGYAETHRFCGSSFMRGGYSRQLCTFVYEPVAAQVTGH